MKKRKLTVCKIVIYCVIFYLIWSIRELIIRPVFLDSLGDIASAIAETLMKLSVWTVPAILLVKYYEADMWISLKEMLTTKVKWVKYLPVLAAFFLYYSMGALISFGKIAIHPDFRPISLISVVLFVGITEEAAFRGWLLNAMLAKMKPWYAVLLNAVLFIFIHYPVWIYRGHDFVTFLSGSVVVFILSIVFSWTFIKSRNIFVNITLHMSWNLFTIIFFGS